MYLRDFIALILAVCAMYVSLQREGSFSFRKAWYHKVDHDYAQLFETVKLPPAVLSDLNGDGTLELLSVTYDGKLQMLKPAPAGKVGEGFARAKVIAEVQIFAPNERSFSHFVHLTTGFLEPLPKELVRAPRKEVVVLVSASWRIYCLDHNLKLLWDKDIPADKKLDHSRMHEISALISSHAIRKGDDGVVIVGGSMLHGDIHNLGRFGQGGMSEDILEDEEEYENTKERHENSRGYPYNDDDQHISGKGSKSFFYYAFDGRSGTLRWKHEAGDFRKDITQLAEALNPQHNYKLTAEEMEKKEYSQISCKDFRESVIEALPHKWERHEDTYFELAHFEKHKVTKGPSKKEMSKSRDKGKSHGIGKNHDNFVAKAVGDVADAAGNRRHVKHHKMHSNGPPNIFVAHLHEGIEAIHLYTGRSICKLHLPHPGLHADIDGDGIIEHVQVYEKEEGENFNAQHAHHHALPGCSTLVTAGPSAHHVFNASICRHPKVMGQNSRRGINLGELQIPMPALLPLSSHRISSSNHGHKSKHTKYELVYLNSYGEVTCLGHHGHRKWSVQTGSGWANLHFSSEVEALVPTVKIMELRQNAHNYVILAAGSYSGHILSSHGKKLTSLDFPESPNQMLQIMDFNADGLNDIVVCTSEGYYGYAQVRHFSTVPFSGLLACLIIAMISVYISLHGAGGKKAKIVRGTESID